MLKFKNLLLKNFLSVGNVIQSINFDRKDLVLILGENLDLGGEASGSRNGVGKCLRGSTNIDITFKNEQTKQKFLDFKSRNNSVSKPIRDK